jgi:hypothetical protein
MASLSVEARPTRSRMVSGTDVRGSTDIFREMDVILEDFCWPDAPASRRRHCAQPASPGVVGMKMRTARVNTTR